MTWIPVKERLPGKAGYYLLCRACEDGTIVDRQLYFLDFPAPWPWKHGVFTHWMPLPERPEERTTSKWQIERNHTGKIIGISDPNVARHDLDFICTFQADAQNVEENARRIVACLNAMKGFSTELLEKHGDHITGLNYNDGTQAFRR